MKQKADKPFPWICPACGKATVYAATVAYETHVQHEGKETPVSLPELSVARCRDCNEILFTRSSQAQIAEGVRSKLQLLTPQDIRDGILSLGKTQKDVADELRVSAETLSRWISGSVIQSKNSDKRLRDYFRGKVNLPHRDYGTIVDVDFGALWTSHLVQSQRAKVIVSRAKSAWGQVFTRAIT